MSKLEKCYNASSLSLISIDVREKPSVAKMVIDEIAEFIRHSYSINESGIIYCFSRRESEQVAMELHEKGISANYYHADMDANAREKVHMQWSSGKLQVIVGMEKIKDLRIERSRPVDGSSTPQLVDENQLF